jgi:hypothetical protein
VAEFIAAQFASDGAQQNLRDQIHYFGSQRGLKVASYDAEQVAEELTEFAVDPRNMRSLQREFGVALDSGSAANGLV